MQKNAFIIIGIVLFLSACTESGKDIPNEVQGYVPVYSTTSTYKTITIGAPRPTIRGGKIYTVGNLLFQVETDSGIHVINYANPANPQKLGFIRSVLCKELSVKDGYIYTNNLSDLVVIDINNLNNVHEVGRVASVFPDLALQYPSKTNSWERIYFECPDPAKGVITGWQLQTIKNPKCWR